MMGETALPGWSDFFLAATGASAALAGLLFVAVSINLSRILAFPNLPPRAIEALLAFLSVLAIGTLGLIPRQSSFACGVEIAAVGGGVWLLQTVILVRGAGIERKHSVYPLRVLMNQAPPLSFLAAGLGLALGRPDFAVLIAPGALLSYAAGVFGAWVLLVEIQR
jgi:hypothetical protein